MKSILGEVSDCLFSPGSELEAIVPLLWETVKAGILVAQICLHMLDFD